MAKRTYGSGSLKKLPSGTVEYTVWIDMADGSKARKRFYAKSESEAKRAYKKWLCDGEQAIVKKTVSDWIDEWYTGYKEGKISAGSAKNYMLYIDRHIKPALGKKAVDDVRQIDIETFYRSKSAMSNSAFNYFHIILCGLFKAAIKNGYCSSNPMDDIKKPVKAVKEPGVFSRDSVETILNFAKSDEFGLAVLILLYTGIRRGELTGLMWSDVDLKNESMVIRRAIGRVDGGYGVRETTKTGKVREVALFPELVTALREKLNAESSIGYVLHDDSGKWLSPDQFTRRYEMFFERLNDGRKEEDKVEVLSPHKCRHTFGTYLVSSGANIRAVQQILGHASITTTQIYTHIDIEEGKKNIRKLSY